MDDSVCVGQSASFIASSPCCRAIGVEVDRLIPDSRLWRAFVTTGVSFVSTGQRPATTAPGDRAPGPAAILSVSDAGGGLLRSCANQSDWSGGQPDPARGNSHYVSGWRVDRLADRTRARGSDHRHAQNQYRE